MKKYFDIRSGDVAIIETNTPVDGMIECGERTSYLGARYDFIDGEIVDLYPDKSDEEVLAILSTPPVPEDTELEKPYFITKYEFMERFTDEEQIAIYTVAKSSVQVEVWLDKMKLASDVDLNLPRTKACVWALEEQGLIAKGRADVILKTV